MRKLCSRLRLALPHICGILTATYAGVTLMSQITRSVICLRTTHCYVTKWCAPEWTVIGPGKALAVSAKTLMHALVDQVKKMADGLEQPAEIEARAWPSD
jgi:hypothetical protein